MSYTNLDNSENRRRRTQAGSSSSRVIALLAVGLLAGLIAVSGPGCGGAKVVKTEADPSFTYDEVSKSTIMIGGVTSGVGSFIYKKETRRKLSPLLAKRIAKKRRDLTIVDPLLMPQSLGEERCRELLDRYEETGYLDTSSVVALFDATRGSVRYIVFARVERDTVIYTRSEDGLSIDHKSERFLEMSFRVYDIASADLVFNSSIADQDYTMQIDAKGGEEENCVIESLRCIVTIIDILGWFYGEDSHGFYPPPEVEDMAKRIFDRFTEELPGEQSG